MKDFIAGILFLVIVAVGGYIAIRYFASKEAGSTVYQTAKITRTGVLSKSTVAGADFTHIIVGDGNSWGVASYSVNLDQYLGKKVAATGQNSGTTLYVDSIQVVQ